MYTILIATFFIFVLLLLVCFISQKKSKRICGKHVLVTGGSSGIGKSLAKLAVKEGANVTIVARNVHNLSKAKEELEQCRLNQDQMIQVLSVDVSDCNSVRKKFSEIEETMGPIYMLANCAGLAICGKIEDLSEKDINTMINVNYLGTLYPIQAVVGGMKERRDGIIIITSSQGGLLGIFGLSVYASSKFALRGLSEALDMETRPYNINVTLALPADTDTPGYEKENTTKPLETKLISNVGGLFTPDQVARKILKDALVGL